MNEPLLTVDLEAALAKLALGRLPGPEHAAVALARFAASAHPNRLALRIAGRRLALAHDGGPPGPEGLEALARVLDPGAPETARRRALDALEAGGLLDLLVAFVLPAREARLWAGGRLLEARGRPREVGLAIEAGVAGVRLELAGLEVETRGWARVAAAHLAHARFLAEVDGRRVDHGLALEGVLRAATFRAGALTAAVGLPRAGHAARTRLLEHGVLRREVWASPPGGEVWDALVDGPPGLEREALALAAESAARLLGEARGFFGQLGPQDRRRLAQLLFRKADAGGGPAAVAGVPLFRAISGEAYRAEELAGLARGRVLRVLGPGARAERHRVDGPVLVLDEEERAFVERHLGLVLREPPRRAAPPGPLRRLRRAWSEALARAARGVRRRLLARREVPRGALEPAEEAFRAALEEALCAGLLPGREGAAVRFCRGRLLAASWERGQGGPRLWLGRGHPRVRAAVSACGRDPRLQYAAWMLLVDGADAFGARREEAVARLVGLG